MIRLLSAVGFLLILGLVPSAAGAQEATPVAGFTTPDPAECTVAPRTVDELKAYLANPGTPAATPDPATFTVPTGDPASDEQVAGVTATINELNACVNANAFLRMFALYSDGYLARSITGEDLNPDALAYFATPVAPQAADKRMSYQVQDIMVLDDGRIGAVIVTFSPYGGTYTSEWMAFVEQDGRYLMDEIVALPDGAGQATPAAG
jgi:hypothetical protein